MALRLSSADIASLERATTVLLAPFAYESSESWRLAASRAVEDCIGADASAFVLPVANEPYLTAVPDVRRAFQAILPPPEWIVRGLTVRRRELGLGVLGWDDAFDINDVKRSSWYNDVASPERLLAPIMMVADSVGNIVPPTISLCFANERAAEPRAHRRKQLLRLIFPAFCAGLNTYIGFHRNSAAMNALVEDAPIGVLVFDRRGSPGRENEFFRRLMEGEPERDRVRAEVAHVIRGIFRFPAFDGMPNGRRRGHSEIVTATARYRIATHLFEDQSSPGLVRPVALVERIEGRPLDARELDSRFFLTRREIEAAQLLRRGLSTRQIASALGISLNTARRHIERVLLKLDVHSRAAAAAKLSGG